MSAPETNIHKQEKRHAGPLTGMRVLLIIVGIMLLGWVGWVVIQGQDPQGAETQIEVVPGVGAEEVPGPAAD